MEIKGRAQGHSGALWDTLGHSGTHCIQGAKVQTIYKVDRGIDDVIYDERKGKGRE